MYLMSSAGVPAGEWAPWTSPPLESANIIERQARGALTMLVGSSRRPKYSFNPPLIFQACVSWLDLHCVKFPFLSVTSPSDMPMWHSSDAQCITIARYASPLTQRAKVKLM